MVIIALDHVPHCYSGADGDVIASLVKMHFGSGAKVNVSLAGVDDITSSFVNSAFVSLLDQFGFDYIKANLTISDAPRQAADMIHRCFRAATQRKQAA